MLWTSKSRSRRTEIRKNRKDTVGYSWARLQQSGVLPSIGIAAVFCLVVIAILMLRDEVLPYRPGQSVPYDIVARVDFVYPDTSRLADLQRQASEESPRIYKSNGKVWAELEAQLLTLPEKASVENPAILPEPLKSILDAGAITSLRQYNTPEQRPAYEDAVKGFVNDIQSARVQTSQLILLPDADRAQEMLTDRPIRVEPEGTIRAAKTFSTKTPEFRAIVEAAAKANFRATLTLQPRMVDAALAFLQPTHVYDDASTVEARNNAYASVPPQASNVPYKANQVLVDKKIKKTFDQHDWQLLKYENEAYRRSLGGIARRSTWGLAITAILITVTLSGYVATFQKRIVRNHARAIAIAVLQLSMLLLAQLAAVGSYQLYLLAVAPTILVAMILTIAYDKRFSLGVATTHALLVTIALDQGVGFFIILWVGAMTAAFMLDDIRTRSKLIEVGGATAVAMIIATFAQGMIALEPIPFISTNCLYAGAAGLSAGFITLGILPFIEKAFRITTSMTLLEIADASHPLLRRLALEAPGTYNHSLQVATLSESGAEAIGVNSLLCRVASYYHDIGKINKADYFVENQVNGENRHINLSPSVSLLIIIGHVKDGIELAKEYNLPTSIHGFIQQHHGTTLVEWFYHQACTRERNDPEPEPISEEQYRYPGPKPKSKEVAIVMLADCVESACRAMPEPTASRVETLVHDLAMKRLLDGQFDECDLTIRELALIERAMVKTLLGIYHGRIAYPSTSALQGVSAAIRTA